MSTQDLGAQLNLANQLKDALSGVAEMFSKLGSTAGSQSDSISQLAGSLQEASDSANPDQLNEMDSALRDLAGSLGEGENSTKGFTKAQVAAAVAVSGAVSGFKAFKQTLGATFNMVGSLTSSMFNLAKGAFGALKSTYEGILTIAQETAAAGDQVAAAYEAVRGEFGNLASNEGKAVIDSFQSLRSSGNGLAGTGLSLGRIYGPNNFAGALKDLQGLASELGASFNRLSEDFKNNAAELLVLNKGLGISAKGFAGLADLAKQSGMDTSEALNEVAVQAAVLSKQFGVSSKVIGKNLSQLTENMADFGHMSTAELTATATYAAKLGVEIQSLKGMFDKFANFEDAATGAAKLAETFGMNVDAMALMNAESPAEQMDMMRQAFLETGRSLDDLSRQEKAYLAEQMGVDANDLYAMFDPSNADLSFDDVVAESEAAAEKMSPEEAMADAAKNIEKSIESAMETVKGFFEAFISGFERGLKFTEPFMKASQAIRNALREVFQIGQELAQGLFGKGGAFHPQSMHGVGLLQKVLGNRNDPKSVVGMFVVLKDAIISLAKGEITFSDLIKKMKKTLVDFVQTDHFQELGSYLLTGLEKAIGFVLESATDLINMLASGISEPFSGIDFFGDATSPINQSLAKIFETISNNMGPLKEALGKLVGAIFDSIIDFLMENPKILAIALGVLFGPAVISAVLSSLTTMLMTYITTVLAPAFFSAFTAAASGGGLAGVMAGLKAGIGAVGVALKATITTTLLPFIKIVGIIIAVVMVAKAAFDSITQVFSRLTEKFEKSGSVLELLIGYFTEIVFLPARIVANLVDMIAGFFGFETDVVGAVNTTVDFLVENLLGFFTALPEAIGNVFNNVVTFLGGLGARFSEAFSSAFNAVVDFVGSVGTKFADIAISVGKTILDVAKYFNPAYWAGLAIDAVSGFLGSFDIVSKIKEKISEMFPMVAKLLGIKSPSTVFAEFGQAATDGMAQGAAGMSDAIKGPTQKNIDKIAGDMNKLDTSKINEASGKFMDLEQVSESLSNVNSGLKELETGVSSKKLGAAAKELPLAIDELLKMGDSIVAFGGKEGEQRLKSLNGSLHFFADRIPKIAAKIQAIAEALKSMGDAVAAMVTSNAGVNTETVITGLKRIFGESADDQKAFIPQLLAAFQAVGQEKMKELNGELAFYADRTSQIAGKATAMAESFDEMMTAWGKLPEVTQAAMNVQENVKVLTDAINAVNTSFKGLPEIDAVADVSKVAAALVSDGTVTVKHESMNINVHFKVNIDSKQLAAALGDDAEGGPFFVINTDRGGGGTDSAEAAGG